MSEEYKPQQVSDARRDGERYSGQNEVKHQNAKAITKIGATLLLAVVGNSVYNHFDHHPTDPNSESAKTQIQPANDQHPAGHISERVSVPDREAMINSYNQTHS